MKVFDYFTDRKVLKEKEKIDKKNKHIIETSKPLLRNRDVSIISTNCIGGVFCHDMGMKFLSPTVNLFLYPRDFLKYVANLKKYNSITPTAEMDEKLGYPVGKIDDIKIYFMHYTSCDEAINKWEERKKRINYDKILVMVQDNDFFTDDLYEQYTKIPFNKIFFTTRPKRTCDAVLIDKIFENGRSYIIEERKFYKDGILIDKMNSVD